jgi:hypothetical protein
MAVTMSCMVISKGPPLKEPRPVASTTGHALSASSGSWEAGYPEPVSFRGRGLDEGSMSR